jgi:hypothetical protein
MTSRIRMTSFWQPGHELGQEHPPEVIEVTDGVWRKLPEPVASITLKGQRESSTSYHLGRSMKVHVGAEIVQMLHRIFKACIKRNLRDFKLLWETNVGHILGEWRCGFL